MFTTNRRDIIMTRTPTRVIFSFAVILAAFVALSGTPKANAAHWISSRTTGTPGAAYPTTVWGWGGPSTGTFLTIPAGFLVYRSSDALNYTQVITLKINTWKWNGYNWGTVPARSDFAYRTLNLNQYARFDAMGPTNLSPGFYRVTVELAWAYTNGARIASATLDYDDTTDYGCMTSYCASGMGAWVQIW